MWHGFYGGGWPMLAGGLLFWISLIALIAWAIHRATRHNPTVNHGPRDPLDFAKLRYAKGEITHDQFERIKRDIME